MMIFSKKVILLTILVSQLLLIHCYQLKWISSAKTPFILKNSYSKVFAVDSTTSNTVATKVWTPRGESRGIDSINVNSHSNSSITIDEITAKTVTKDIMAFYNNYPVSASQEIKSKYVLKFSKFLFQDKIKKHVDGMHVITILFQSARVKKLAKTVLPIPFMLTVLQSWNREWTERDISTFIYGIRSLECLDPAENTLLIFAAEKIIQSKYSLTSSRAIGNALYGLQDITSGTPGVKEICLAVATKIVEFQGDLNGQDIGIGVYGLQGISADSVEMRCLISILADKIRLSETEFDAQALSNALYGLQSMSSDFSEVLQLVSALAAKVGESKPNLIAQAIGSALYGLQRLSSDALEVRTLVATLAEKIDESTAKLDAQAIGNALFGLQRMKSNSPEVRALLQALTNKLEANPDIQLDSKGIGSALYGLHNMNTDNAQVRSLISVLAKRIENSTCYLSGQAIADALYGLRGMKENCAELDHLLKALGERMDSNEGKLDSQEIGNALFGLQSLSSENPQVRLIISKLAEKLKRSKAYLRPQHISRSLLGLQSLSSNNKEVCSLLTQMTKRISESDRTPLTAVSIADSLFGLQGMTSDVSEVQDLVGELAKKISSTAAILRPVHIGRALFGLQGLSSSASIFEESALGLDVDEVQFLVSALWDKIKLNREIIPLSSVAMGLQGLASLNDPISNNIKQYLFMQLLKIPSDAEISFESQSSSASIPAATNLLKSVVISPSSILTNKQKDTDINIGTKDNENISSSDESEITDHQSEAVVSYNPVDIIATVRGLSLNGITVPDNLLTLYDLVEAKNRQSPILTLSRQDRLITQKYSSLYPNDANMLVNVLIDGFRADMVFSDISLVIDLDSSSHTFPARQKFDSLRDDYFASKLGLKVKRIKISGINTEEAVKSIRDAVFELREQKADTEIQKLYSRK